MRVNEDNFSGVSMNLSTHLHKQDETQDQWSLRGLNLVLLLQDELPYQA